MCVLRASQIPIQFGVVDKLLLQFSYFTCGGGFSQHSHLHHLPDFGIFSPNELHCYRDSAKLWAASHGLSFLKYLQRACSYFCTGSESLHFCKRLPHIFSTGLHFREMVVAVKPFKRHGLDFLEWGLKSVSSFSFSLCCCKS